MITLGINAVAQGLIVLQDEFELRAHGADAHCACSIFQPLPDGSRKLASTLP